MNKTTQENTHLKIEDIFNRFITLLAALIVTCLGIAALFHTIIFPLDYSETVSYTHLTLPTIRLV